MTIHMTFKHMDATEALKNHVNDRSQRVKKFIPTDSEITWILYVDADVHTADLKIQGPHVDYFAQARTPDLYQSIDEAMDKIEKQLIRHKEITKDHLHRNRSSATPVEVDTDTEDSDS